VTDVNTLAGIVRAHVAAKEAGIRLVVGCRLALDFSVLVYPTDRAAYGRLCRLLTLGKRRAGKGECDLGLYDLVEHQEGLLAVVVPPVDLDGDFVETLAGLQRVFDDDRLSIATSCLYGPDDGERMRQLVALSEHTRIPLAATNDVHYHEPQRRPLQDVLTSIRLGCTVAGAGLNLFPHAERYLKPPAEMARLFAGHPRAIDRTVQIARRAAFSLDELRYQYPQETCPPGRSPIQHLAELTRQGAQQRYPHGVGEEVRNRIVHELRLIDELDYARYFLTVHDLVEFANSRGILCQGRGAAANSAVCYCLGVTAVDPDRIDLLFERFVSRERNEPPDIDIDFEHERREEVIQYIYRKYGRDRAALAATVVSYRPRSAIRAVGKALGFSLAEIDLLARNMSWWDEPDRLSQRLTELGFDVDSLQVRQLLYLVQSLIGFPRHLSQHVGGFVISENTLASLVPVENASMADRTVIQWDKDDSAAVGMVKFDLLGLGMLNALHLATDLIEDTHGIEIDLARIAQESAIYRSMTRSDTVGLFQIESRAQMATLPKMKPKTFYDLAVEVALIRPGPIQGQSVHPYLRRRNGEEPIRYPHPSTESILKKTLGVPIFQEQLMELARICAGFDGSQADRLRQAMTHKRSEQAMGRLEDEVYVGMAGKGITDAAADEIWEKLQGFASFGFPESHSVSFAYIVYMSTWLRFHYPAEYLAGLLNAQPMGFYSPNSLVQDAQRHGVVVLAPDVNVSWHDCTVEPIDADPEDIVTYLGQQWRRGRGHVEDAIRPAVGVRMGLRYVRNLGESEITRVEAARVLGGEFASPEDLAFRTGLDVDSLEGLAAAGALESIGLGRREGMWAAGALAEIDPERLPLSPGVEAPGLEEMTEEESHRADLWSTGVSARHPMSFVRDQLEDCLTAAEALEMKRNGSRVKVAGVITHRQRPGTAKGVYFLNLEDETGLLNIVVLPDVWAKHRNVVRKSPALVIHGRLEYHDGVTNIVARDFEPLGVQTVRSRDFR